LQSEVTFSFNAADFGGALLCASIANAVPGSVLTVLNGSALFLSNVAKRSGGAIYLQGLKEAEFVLTSDSRNIVFERNMAAEGAAISSEFFVSIESKGLIFRQNIASLHGGAMYLSDTNLRLSYAHFGGNSAKIAGGAVVAFDSTLLIIGTAFFNNSAHEDGGAVAIYKKSSVELRNSSLMRNFLNGSTLAQCRYGCGGGALLCSDFAFVLISGGTVLEGNSAQPWDGGAILARNKAQVKVQASTITLNFAAGFGGGAAATGSAILVFETGVRIEQNFAGKGGGAIFAGGQSVRMASVTISGNHAGEIGGGMLMYCTVEVDSHSEFVQNEAENGGAVFASGKFARLIVKPAGSVQFEGNTARNHGGGVYLEDSAGYEVEYEACPDSCSGFNRGNGVCDMAWYVHFCL
jgi:predicted outer membrane repeat protein